ncbi:glutathione S-transferase N-terminal domain-containing protein [Methylophaga sp. OBS3]|uniref:glutathione S-transferase N-terminal domain-containing protein n=1 Tax=Methylophaga sp. OBS3 TaxID=2991934 RepID=UPI002255B04D|nr:glutathione S-transferase N-terminal domain-containing protein [Methylophaga sp. OBS3]MCX4190784.1 glutathione S-transferase N-terminal domain-containing protein [Methylophaga sp. OBS3]
MASSVSCWPRNLAIMLDNPERRTRLTLYSESSCPFGQQIRFALEEKGVDYQFVTLESGEWPEFLADINPTASGPTLIDRDVALYDPCIILEYLDERYPHPALMPASPADRARIRLMLSQLSQNWQPLIHQLQGRSATKARRTLKEDITVMAPLLSNNEFAYGQQFSLLDCFLLPFLWHLPEFGVKLPASAAAVERYAKRLYSRPAFKASLTTASKD